MQQVSQTFLRMLAELINSGAVVVDTGDPVPANTHVIGFTSGEVSDIYFFEYITFAAVRELAHEAGEELQPRDVVWAAMAADGVIGESGMYQRGSTGGTVRAIAIKKVALDFHENKTQGIIF